jgi:hypothetical protein
MVVPQSHPLIIPWSWKRRSQEREAEEEEEHKELQEFAASQGYNDDPSTWHLGRQGTRHSGGRIRFLSTSNRPLTRYWAAPLREGRYQTYNFSVEGARVAVEGNRTTRT